MLLHKHFRCIWEDSRRGFGKACHNSTFFAGLWRSKLAHISKSSLNTTNAYLGSRQHIHPSICPCLGDIDRTYCRIQSISGEVLSRREWGGLNFIFLFYFSVYKVRKYIMWCFLSPHLNPAEVTEMAWSSTGSSGWRTDLPNVEVGRESFV